MWARILPRPGHCGPAQLFILFHQAARAAFDSDPEFADRASRLALCALALRVLLGGLAMLGVPVPERMQRYQRTFWAFPGWSQAAPIAVPG